MSVRYPMRCLAFFMRCRGQNLEGSGSIPRGVGVKISRCRGQNFEVSGSRCRGMKNFFVMCLIGDKIFLEVSGSHFWRCLWGIREVSDIYLDVPNTSRCQG